MVDKDFAWRLAQELVRIDSSDPGAYEGEIERYIKALVEERLARLNHPTLDAVQIEEIEVLPGRRNLMVTVPGLNDEPRLVYICHMDTVTLGDGWDAGIPPLGAIVHDDKLYGRGACDMKGGLACAIAKPFKNRLVGVAVGTAAVCGIRFLCSFLSGVLIWGNLSDGLPAWTYSLTYNGSYMLPETILTTVAAVLIYKAAPQLFAEQEK